MTATHHVVCVHCHTTNRVPVERSAAELNCGQCHRALFEDTPVSLDQTALDTQLNKSDIPVVVDFWAPWCGPCHAMAPAFAQACTQLQPKVRLVKLNTDEAQALAARYNIRSIPTLLAFKGGQEVARRPGVMSANDIVRWVQLVTR